MTGEIKDNAVAELARGTKTIGAKKSKKGAAK
jgi:hypothetical protein